MNLLSNEKSFRRVCKTLCLSLFAVLTFASSNDVSASGYQDLAISRFTVCVVDQGGNLKCAPNEQLSRYPAPDDNVRYTDVTLGDTHGCAVTIEGGLRCWGDNSFNQLNSPTSSTPFVSVEAGANHTCALDENSLAVCWGLNSNGQTDVPSTSEPYAKLVLGQNGSCAIDFIGAVACWSTDASYESYPFIRGARDVAPGERCFLTNMGNRFCTREILGENIPPFPTARAYVDMESSRGYYCARTAEGSIDCTTGNSEFRSLEEDQLFASRIASMPPVTSYSIFRNAVFDSQNNFVENALCGLTFEGEVSCVGTVQGAFELFADDAIGVAGVASPENLRALRYSDSTLELLWEFGRPIDAIGFNIYRNNELLAFTSNALSYVDNTLEANKSYTYSISALDLNGLEGVRSNSASVGDDGGGTSRPVEPAVGNTNTAVKNLMVQRYGDGSLELFWDRLENTAVSKTLVYRNGVNVQTVPGNSYFDNTVNGSDTYHYTIVVLDSENKFLAVGTVGVESSTSSCQ